MKGQNDRDQDTDHVHTAIFRSINLVLWIGGLCVVAFLSFTPSPPVDLSKSHIPFLDKAGHFTAYFLLALFPHYFLVTGRSIMIALWVIISAGILVEITQGGLNSRTASLSDLLFNILSVGVGTWTARVWNGRSG